MALHRCTSCRRHVRAQERACPFCAARLATAYAPVPMVLGLVAGMAIVGCGEGKSTDDGVTAHGQMTGTAETGGATINNIETDSGGDDYGGAEFNDLEEGSDEEGPDATTGADSSSGAEASTGDSTGGGSDSTGTGTGTGTGSDSTGGDSTGTGSTSADQSTTTDAGGVDYGGAPPSEPKGPI